MAGAVVRCAAAVDEVTQRPCPPRDAAVAIRRRKAARAGADAGDAARTAARDARRPGARVGAEPRSAAGLRYIDGAEREGGGGRVVSIAQLPAARRGGAAVNTRTLR